MPPQWQVAGNIIGFEVDGKREVGYWIGKEYWGQGIATKALAAFLEEVKKRPLYAHVAKHNVRSRRLDAERAAQRYRRPLILVLGLTLRAALRA